MGNLYFIENVCPGRHWIQHWAVCDNHRWSQVVWSCTYNGRRPARSQQITFVFRRCLHSSVQHVIESRKPSALSRQPSMSHRKRNSKCSRTHRWIGRTGVWGCRNQCAFSAKRSDRICSRHRKDLYYQDHSTIVKIFEKDHRTSYCSFCVKRDWIDLLWTETLAGDAAATHRHQPQTRAGHCWQLVSKP